MTFFLVRMKIWSNKGHAEKNKVTNLENLNLKLNFQVFMEEWLTDYRAKLMKKCQTLLKVAWSKNPISFFLFIKNPNSKSTLRM